MTYFDNK